MAKARCSGRIEILEVTLESAKGAAYFRIGVLPFRAEEVLDDALKFLVGNLALCVRVRQLMDRLTLLRGMLAKTATDADNSNTDHANDENRPEEWNPRHCPVTHHHRRHRSPFLLKRSDTTSSRRT